MRLRRELRAAKNRDMDIPNRVVPLKRRAVSNWRLKQHMAMSHGTPQRHHLQTSIASSEPQYGMAAGRIGTFLSV